MRKPYKPTSRHAGARRKMPGHDLAMRAARETIARPVTDAELAMERAIARLVAATFRAAPPPDIHVLPRPTARRANTG